MVALHASYHTKYLSTLYNRHNSPVRFKNLTDNCERTIRADGIALPELVSFIERDINDKGMLSPCTHEETDTRVMLHVLHSVHQGFENICIRTVDTDVVVLAVEPVN